MNLRALIIRTKNKDEIIDLTDDIEHALDAQDETDGICLIQAMHTTCAITTADLDPGTDKDLLDALRAIAPKISYRHPHDPKHAPDHILSSIIGPSVSIPFRNKKLLLGTWQRVILVELDGPRERKVNIMICSA